MDAYVSALQDASYLPIYVQSVQYPAACGLLEAGLQLSICMHRCMAKMYVIAFKLTLFACVACAKTQEINFKNLS